MVEKSGERWSPCDMCPVGLLLSAFMNPEVQEHLKKAQHEAYLAFRAMMREKNQEEELKRIDINIE